MSPAMNSIRNRPLAGGALAALAEQYPLLITKLYLPRLAPSLLTRPQLMARLHRAAAYPLVCLAAPAGWGRTTLVASWAQPGRDTHRLALTGRGGQRAGSLLVASDRGAASDPAGGGRSGAELVLCAGSASGRGTAGPVAQRPGAGGGAVQAGV